MTRDDDTIERPGSRAALPPMLSWTLLAEANGEHGDAARNALVARYYRPVRAYLGAIVRDTERTDELTQAFFERVVLSWPPPAGGGSRPRQLPFTAEAGAPATS